MQGDRLKQLTGQFLQRAAEEVQLLRTQLPHARDAEQAALQAMLRVTHGLHGSAGMLGFKFISECAGQIERILRRADPHPTVSDWQMIELQLRGIEAELKRMPDVP